MTTELIKQDADITELQELLQRLQENLQGACRFIAERMKQDPTFIERFCDAHPEYNPAVLQRMELAGLGKIHPKLISLYPTAGTRRLERLPVELQERYLEEGVALVIIKDGCVETLKAKVENLMPVQAAQVFDRDHIRTEAEQRLWIESNRVQQPKAAGASGYTISGTGRSPKLIVLEPRTFTRRDLRLILSEMDKRQAA
jgi:hypothetical protein